KRDTEVEEAPAKHGGEGADGGPTDAARHGRDLQSGQDGSGYPRDDPPLWCLGGALECFYSAALSQAPYAGYLMVEGRDTSVASSRLLSLGLALGLTS